MTKNIAAFPLDAVVGINCILTLRTIVSFNM